MDVMRLPEHTPSSEEWMVGKLRIADDFRKSSSTNWLGAAFVPWVRQTLVAEKLQFRFGQFRSNSVQEAFIFCFGILTGGTQC